MIGDNDFPLSLLCLTFHTFPKPCSVRWFRNRNIAVMMMMMAILKKQDDDDSDNDDGHYYNDLLLSFLYLSLVVLPAKCDEIWFHTAEWESVSCSRETGEILLHSAKWESVSCSREGFCYAEWQSVSCSIVGRDLVPHCKMSLFHAVGREFVTLCKVGVRFMQ